MGITQLIPAFYKDLPAETFRKVTLLGQFCWVPIPNLEVLPLIMDVQRADPREHGAVTGEIRDMREIDFKKKNRLPIKALNLRETEELLVQRTKKRLAVVLSSEFTIFDDVAALLKSRGQKHLQERSILIAPLYGIEAGEHHGGFPPIMVARARALMYKQFFYCPVHPPVYEGIVRFDRLQPLRPHYRTIEQVSVALSSEALAVLLTMVRALFGAPPDEEFLAMQELLKETLPPEAQPTGHPSVK